MRGSVAAYVQLFQHVLLALKLPIPGAEMQAMADIR